MVNSQQIFVKYNKIDEKQFSFLCPFCVSVRGQICSASDAKKYKSAKPNYHFHGSCGKTHNRIENRGSHCLFFNGTFIISIDDDTQRI